jgi:O-antigen/teichoic acid export membrane protein
VSRKLSAQLGVLGSGVVIGLFFRFVQGALLARLLGVSEFGKLATIAALMAIISRVNDLGLPSAVAYHFRHMPGSLSSLMRVVYLDFAWCCAVSLAVAFVAPHLPLLIAPDLRASGLLQGLLAAYIAVNTPTWILPAFISAAGDYRAYARLTNLDAGLQAALAVGACLLFGASYPHVIAALTIEQSLMIGLYLWFLRRYREPALVARVGMRETLAYGLRLQWGVLMKLLSSRVDILTVGALTNSALAGWYSVALNIRDIGLLPQSVYAAPFQNLVIDRSRAGSPSDRAAVITGLLLQAALSLVMVITAVVALPLLIPTVYGPAFRPAIAPAVILFCSILFLGPAGLCWMAFNAKGRPQLTSVLLTATGILGPALTLVLLVSGHGLRGIATGGLIMSALTLGLALFLLQRLQHYRRSDLGAGIARAGAILRAAASHVRTYMAQLVDREV